MADLIDIRKDSFGNWEPLEIEDEAHTVPSADPYIITLVEVPSDGLIEDYETESPVVTIGSTELTEITSEESLGENMFFVNYDTGEVTFHEDNAGDSATITYWGLGSLIFADDINDLRNRITVGTAAPDEDDTGYEVGSLWTYSDRVWVCLKNTDPATWVEWGGNRIFRRDEDAGTETSIELDEDCGVSIYVNKPLDTTTPEEYLALRINCSGQVYIPDLVTGDS